MVFGFGKSEQEKINEVYSHFTYDLLDFMKIPGTESKLFLEPFYNFVKNYLDVYSVNDKITLDVYPYVSAKDISILVQNTSKSKQFSDEETELYRDLIIASHSIFYEMWMKVLPTVRPNKIVNLKKTRIKKETIVEEFGASGDFGLFQRKVFSEDIFGYYILYNILDSTNTFDHLMNFLKKYFLPDNFNLDELDLLKDLLIHEIQHISSPLSLTGTKYDVSPTHLKISAYYLKQTCILESFIGYKNYLKTKIHEYYDPKSLDNYIDAFLEITDSKIDSRLPLLIQIFREDGIVWKSNVLGNVLQRQKLMQINSFKRNLSDDSIPDVNSMDGIQFEHFLGTLFDKMGYSVEITKASGDQGADLIIKKNSEIIAVQAKRYSEKVNNSAVQQITGSLKFYHASRGMVVTTSDFTKSAYDLATSNNVELINGEQLNRFITKYW
ncbi:MAG: restriction endonuclease [Candidatus Nitrosopumilus sp. bin_6a]